MQFHNSMNNFFAKVALVITICFLPTLSWAQEAKAVAGSSESFLLYILAGLAVLLVFVIYALALAVRTNINLRKKQILDARSSKVLALLLFLGSMGSATISSAQEAAAVVEEPSWISKFTENLSTPVVFLLIVIALELLVIFILNNIQLKMLRPEEDVKKVVAPAFTWKKLINYFGSENTEEEVKALDLQHDYDGIRELDNNIPSWWQFGFALSILFGVVYMFRMFGTGSLPDQETELKEAQRVAAIEMEAYLKNSANNVDENTVVMLDEGGIAAGKDLYAKNCVACHGDNGGGTIGPNLTDEYWVHKGGIKDVFYSIKYGWPDKGMKAWKDDFSPVQIAQISSFVKSLAGTTPTNPKAAEGEKYTEEGGSSAETTAPAATADSTVAQ